MQRSMCTVTAGFNNSVRFQISPSKFFTEVWADPTTDKFNYFFINNVDSHVLYLWPNSLIMPEYNSCEVACLRGLTTPGQREADCSLFPASLFKHLFINYVMLACFYQNDILA